MGTKWVAIAITLLAIVVLATLIKNAQSVGIGDHAQHYQLINDIDKSITHYQSIIDQLSNAQASAQPVGSGLARVSRQLTNLGELVTRRQATDSADVSYLKESYGQALKDALARTSSMDRQQTKIALAMGTLREQGPREVQRLRNNKLDEESKVLYQLMLSVVSLNSLNDATRNEEAQELLAHARDLKMPNNPYAAGMIKMADQVIAGQTQLREEWAALTAVPVIENAQSLYDAYQQNYAQIVKNAENARVLLSLSSIVLFASLGYLIYRLQRSYVEINYANDQLNHVNERLEKRVSERTHELNQAFQDLKDSQVQLVQAEKMASLGQLVAGISHEINTPLLYLQSNQAVIQEMLSEIEEFVDQCHDKLLSEQTTADDITSGNGTYNQGLVELKQYLIDSQIKEELKEINELSKDSIQGLDELTEMARGLKDFSRLDRAPIDSFNINEGIERTLVIAKNILKNHIRVVKNLADVPSIACAPSQINQVLLNLITNAAQSIDGTGTITITSSHNKGVISVSIADTGCGISQENLAKIRDPFFTTKPAGQGTGLGLSICEEILRAHNGSMEIESKPGEGSCFTIWLPIVGAHSSYDVMSDNSAAVQFGSNNATILPPRSIN